ncbi:MAG TPA: aminodeoxychorismate/anthranilate synthase component II [Acidimicrobiales bacterium]|nr:aminodeoxychorismate/anthranilate synthase component II [Acidimicrobiales bacterium]
MPRVVVIDNYDSFVYNLVQYLGELGAEPDVYRPDEISLEGIEELRPDALVISPGPGRPEDAKLSNAAIERFARHRTAPETGKVTFPILGVCLGHQCIGQIFGGEVVRAPAVVHGKTSLIRHRGQGVLAGLADPFEATRYHSLLVDRDTVPPELEITAETDDGLVMGLRHRQLAVEGVQFHPESILTADGRKLLTNFLAQAGGDAATG